MNGHEHREGEPVREVEVTREPEGQVPSLVTPDWIEVDEEGKPRGVVSQAGRRRAKRRRER